MRKLYFTFLILLLALYPAVTPLFGQATISCPSNITVNATSGQCGAVVSYTAPSGTCPTGGTQSTTFSFTGSLATWTVPAGVTSARFEAWGGQGGNETWGGTDFYGGKGAYMSGDFAVSGGQVYKIMVGAVGMTGSVGGGGGGSFIATSGNAPRLVAGGGGGASSDQDGVDAPTTNNGTKDGLGAGTGGTAGSGGGVCGLNQNDGGGGGGFYGDGATANTGGTTNGGFGGKSFVNGGAGGPGGRLDNACTQDADGGYGGGGGTTCYTVGGGGGGGYSGGAGGQHYNNCVTGAVPRAGGGAGGSYNSGTSQNNIAGNRSGNGQVKITWTVPSTPTISQTTGSGSGVFFPVGTTTNTFSASCPSGSPATCSFNVTVVDNQNPTITCPANITANAASGQCGANVTYSVTSSDNCAGQTTSKTAGLNSGSLFPVGTTTNSWKATDAAGNVANCSFNVTVVDNQNPTITCPSNMTVNAGSGGCTAVVTYSVTSADNCSGQSVNQLAGMASGASFPAGTTTNTWRATDASGNIANCSFNVTVVDNQNPTITCPSNITANAASGQCSAVVTYSVTSADNCSGQSVSQLAGLASGASFPVGTTSNTFKVTDASGNVANCGFNVTVNDNQNPTITCPANITANASSGQCAAVVTYSVTSADNCSGQTVSQLTGLASGASFPVGTTSNTYKATDAAGNVANCGFNVTVVDNQNPTITCPSNITVNAASNNCTPNVTWTAPTSGDNCGITTNSQSHTSGSAFSPGTTTVTYTVGDAAGNSGSCSFTVSVVPAPLVLSFSKSTFNCGYNVSCNGATNGTAGVTVTGGCEPYTYAWSNSSTNANLSGLAAGTYTLTVTDNNGATSNGSVTLTEPSVLSSSLTSPPGVCGPNANNGFVDLTVAGGASCQAYSFSWTGPGSFTANTEDLNNISIGTYMVAITDANGCGLTDTVTLNAYTLPVADLGADTTICDGSTYNLNPGSFASYLWQDNSTGSSLPVTVAGLYWSEITDANGCQDRDSVVISVHTVTAPTWTSSETLPLCQSDTATLTASAGYSSYLWSGTNLIGALNNASVDVVSPGGNVNLSVSDQTGCVRTDVITIPFVNQPDPNPVIMPNPGILCPGGEDLMDAGAGFASYLWNTGAATQTITVNTAGTYSVEVTNSAGCGEIATASAISVPGPNPVITQSNDTLWVQIGFVTYQWSINGTPLAFATQNFYVPPVSGQYSVTVVDGNGCSATVTFDVTVGLEEGAVFAGLEVFPNPTDGILTIRPYAPVRQEVEVRIFDLYGKIVQQRRMAELTTDQRLDLTNLAAGIYILDLATEQGKFTRKIMVQ